MSLTVLCPTRGRPRAARETWDSFFNTKRLPDTSLVFIVNDDEDAELLYKGLPYYVVPRQEWMNEVLQAGFDKVVSMTDPKYVGFIGDDNRFRSMHWDLSIVEVLEKAGGGIAYGNDLAQGPNLPAHVFMNTAIPKALGYFGLRGSHHLYLDNAWRELGLRSGCLYYLEQVIIEHLHPLFGKGEWDDSYRNSNSHAQYFHDQEVFGDWLKSGAVLDDVGKVKAVIGG